MRINIMSENDFNFRGSEDIVNKGDPHWPRTRHHQKSTPNLQKTPFPEQVPNEFWKFGYRPREVDQLNQCG